MASNDAPVVEVAAGEGDLSPLVTTLELEFFYHYNALVYSTSQAGIDAVVRCIVKTVPRNHPERDLLQKATVRRRWEIDNGIGRTKKED